MQLPFLDALEESTHTEIAYDGTTYTLADHTGGMSVISAVGKACPTTNMRVDYLTLARGDFRATATVVRRGGRSRWSVSSLRYGRRPRNDRPRHLQGRPLVACSSRREIDSRSTRKHSVHNPLASTIVVRRYCFRCRTGGCVSAPFTESNSRQSLRPPKMNEKWATKCIAGVERSTPG
ncbi:PaaI family thioesterase [Natrinema gelatinilyticum]|uniref:PaaI family thioesterase n=1 Tax=Natrinema gelatinilyticum TaxID=2961571 RepID=UPI003CE46F3A